MMDEDAASQDHKLEQDLSVYAGRWVALAGEQVAGVGDTAVAAERLGRRNRLREALAVYFVEPEGGNSLALPEQLSLLRPIFQRHDQPVHLVGGAVRDMLLGRPIKDLDFVTPQGAIRLAYKVADSLDLPAYILDRERDAGRVILPDGETTLDFACYRGEDLLGDLRSRDFTINAMALPVAARTEASLIDPCSGQLDLAAGVIRQTHQAAISDDPVRAMRAIRHAIDFDFDIVEETRDAVRGAAVLLESVSIERVRDELMKMMHSHAPASALHSMFGMDLLPTLLPEVAILVDIPQTPPHFESVLAHTERVLSCLARIEGLLKSDQSPPEAKLAEAHRWLYPYRRQLEEHLERRLDGGVSGRQALRLGALFHDVGKAQSMSVEPDGRIRFFGHDETGAKLTAYRLAALRLSREVIREVKTIVRGHMRPLLLAQNPELSRRSVYRFFRDYDHTGLDITLLAMADQMAVSGLTEADPQWQRLLHVVAQLHLHYFEHFSESVRPKAFLDGRDMMEILQIEPGPEIGRLMRLLLEAQAAGEVKTREESVSLVKRLTAENRE